MEKSFEVDVKIISREAVKPSIPTPYRCENFTLCYLDQILPLAPPFLTSGLLFFATTPQTKPLDHVRCLKSSLSKTLTRFYPLAGRIKQSTITCNDEGIPFITTQVNCPLSHVLNLARKLDLVTKFLPPQDSLGLGDAIVDELIHLAIQVNVFTCGGIAMGWYDIHKHMDGSSSATFFKHWAALASKNYNEEVLVQPDFDAAIVAFPPSPKLNLLHLADGYMNDVQVSSILVKNFLFKSHSVTSLKGRAASKIVPNPTRFQALAGFIWEQLQVVSLSKTKQYDDTYDTVLQVTVDMRPFTTPALPRGSMGNLVNTAVARADKRAKLPELVVEIHAAVSKMKDEIRKYDGEKGVETVRASWDNLIKTVSNYKDKAYKVVSWCKLGFSDLDFGFGKPKWMVPTDGVMSPFHRNLIILMDSMDSNGDGMEAWFFLEEKDMEILVSNKEFLSYASPL